jgi:hypothetical protein
MSTVRKTARRVKVRSEETRTVCLTHLPASQPGAYVLDIVQGKVSCSYWLTALPADFGRAFRLQKFQHQGGECYDVLLDGEKSTCECMGHLRWQTWCKHIQALRQLEAAGRLPQAPRPGYRSCAEFAASDPEGYEAMLREFPPLRQGEDAEAERRYGGGE